MGYRKGAERQECKQREVVFRQSGRCQVPIEAGYSLTTIWEHMHETGR
ncbi:TraK family protein [Escherichia coli]